jgi:thiol-disulfide isomerase/thioredoxin
MDSMSRLVRNRDDLAEALRSCDRVFILFYATWCPFSMAFLPAYEKQAAGRERYFLQMTLNGNEDLFDEHEIEVYPTVLFFKAGKLDKRLDGKHLAGLKERQLEELIDSCGLDGD